MWSFFLKLRDYAKQYLMMDVYNGEHTSFWYDSWSQLGCLKDVLGRGGNLAMGITEDSHVADVLMGHRRRRHRLSILNEVEEEIEKVRNRRSEKDDIPLWKQNGNTFANSFSTKKTWQSMRQVQPVCDWNKGVWFPQSTPKFSFFVWVAIRNRLPTCDRMKLWNNAVYETCVLRTETEETCRHLFFGCRYSRKIWRELAEGIMGNEFTYEWNDIIHAISRHHQKTTEGFLLCYAFQVLVHIIWRERNARRHGEQPRDEG